MYCGSQIIVKRRDNAAWINRLRCRSWKCQHCRPKRSRLLIADARAGHPDTFITLTLQADDPASRPDQVKALSRAWRCVRLAAMRKYNLKALPFLAVVEKTKRGTPHLHIVARVPWIDQKWLSQQMQRLVAAPIVDIRRIDRHRSVAAYIAKYIGKDPTQFPGSKRYWQSRDFRVEPKHDKNSDRKEGDTFELHKMSLEMFLTGYDSFGLMLVAAGDEWAFAYDPRHTNHAAAVAAFTDRLRYAHTTEAGKPNA